MWPAQAVSRDAFGLAAPVLAACGSGAEHAPHTAQHEAEPEGSLPKGLVLDISLTRSQVQLTPQWIHRGCK